MGRGGRRVGSNLSLALLASWIVRTAADLSIKKFFAVQKGYSFDLQYGGSWL